MISKCDAWHQNFCAQLATVLTGSSFFSITKLIFVKFQHTSVENTNDNSKKLFKSNF